METDIGNPIEYSPNMDPLIQEKNEDNTEELVQDQPYYYHPSEMNFPQQQPQTGKFVKLTKIIILLYIYKRIFYHSALDPFSLML